MKQSVPPPAGGVGDKEGHLAEAPHRCGQRRPGADTMTHGHQRREGPRLLGTLQGFQVDAAEDASRARYRCDPRPLGGSTCSQRMAREERRPA